MSEMRRVRNVGEQPLVDAFDGTHYWIEPGNEAVVPLEAVNLWCGDNLMVDTPNRRYRYDELMRLRIRYGALDTGAEDHDGKFWTADDLWERNRPHVVVTTLDGDETDTLLTDPNGDKVTVSDTTIDEKAELWGLIEQQRRELAALQRDFQTVVRKEDAAAMGDVEEDEPQVVPSRKARGRATTSPPPTS